MITTKNPIKSNPAKKTLLTSFVMSLMAMTAMMVLGTADANVSDTLFIADDAFNGADSTTNTLANFTPLPANERTNPPDTDDKEVLLELANQATWQRLLLIKNGKSSVQDDRFFLTDKNQKDLAYQELIALKTALENPKTPNNKEIICRFPARSAWLGDKMGLAVDFGSCDEFNAWYKAHSVVRLSLVFAEEHPNNLSSAFAHVFIKGDTMQSLKNHDDNQALAINYTVASQPNDKPLATVIKPMVGGYAGVMEFLAYQDKKNSYLKTDNRNLWEYPLQLSEPEVKEILYHIWEIKGIQRSYFFTHNNCATEILRLIDLVKPNQSLREKSANITIPSEIARLLAKEGLTDTPIFLPSDQSIAQAQLNTQNHQKNLNTDLSITHQSNHPITTKHGDPAHAQPNHRLSVGVGRFDNGVNDKKNYATIAIRSAYHDVLDKPFGVREYLDLSILSLDAKVDKNNIKINDLTIFSSRSYNPTNTAKAYNGVAHGGHLKVIQALDGARDNEQHTVLHLGVEWGRSVTLRQGAAGTGDLANTLCYAFGTGMGEVGKIEKGYRVGVGAVLGCIYHASDRLRLNGELSLPYWYQGNNVGRDGYWQPTATLGVQYDVSHRTAIRLKGVLARANDKTVSDVSVAYAYYF